MRSFGPMFASEPLVMMLGGYQPSLRGVMLATYLPHRGAHHAPRTRRTERGHGSPNAMAPFVSSLSRKDLSGASVMIVQVRQLRLSNRVGYGCP